MTWHLKDKQLEEKLIGLCSDFLEALNNGVYSKRKDENYILVSFDREKLGNYLDGNELLFWMDELEEVHEYNPNAWNEFPKVPPPKDVIMRVEFKRSDEGVKAFWDGENWRRCRSTGICWNPVIEKDISRFRPWEN